MAVQSFLHSKQNHHFKAQKCFFNEMLSFLAEFYMCNIWHTLETFLHKKQWKMAHFLWFKHHERLNKLYDGWVTNDLCACVLWKTFSHHGNLFLAKITGHYKKKMSHKKFKQISITIWRMFVNIPDVKKSTSAKLGNRWNIYIFSQTREHMLVKGKPLTCLLA